MKWHYLQAGEQKGPVELEFLKDLVQKGELNGTDYVWNQNMGDKWTRINELPILGVPPATIQPGTDETFKQRLEERNAMEARERTMGRIKGAVALLVLAGLISLTVVWVKGKPFRKWGINSDNPVGNAERITGELKGVAIMTESTVPSHPIMTRKCDRISVYNDPKVKRGMFVSGEGSTYLFTDAGGKLLGIVAEYPSPGMRGMAQINPSLTSLFAEDYWKLLAGGETHFKLKETVPADIMRTFGLTGPEKASWATFDNGKVRGVWLQYGDYNSASLMVIQDKRW